MLLLKQQYKKRVIFIILTSELFTKEIIIYCFGVKVLQVTKTKDFFFFLKIFNFFFGVIIRVEYG